MSDDISKADTIAFHFYTKLFYTVNHARATEETRVQTKLDKWFNLETPDSDLFTREAREPYRSISQSPPPGPLPMEIQVLLSVPELTNNQALVYISPDSTRVRIEPTPRFILLETWTLGMNLDHRVASTDISPPVIYKHGIILFRSLFSLLRVLPTWKFYKRLKRRVGRNGHLGIQLRVRPSGGSGEMDRSILGFDERLSPIQRSPLQTSTHTFPPVPHLLGSFTLQTTYLSTPHFQLDELESLLSSRFISLDLEGFVPTLDKNKQRDSLSGSSSLPNSSGIRSMLSRSPPKAIGMGRTTSAGSGIGAGPGVGADHPIVADRFILPTRLPSMGAPTTGTTALIPPPRPSFPFPSGNPSVAAAQPIPGSGLAVHRLRKESLNSSSSSSISARDRDNPYPANPPFSPTATTAAGGGASSLSSSPIPGALPIRKPHINPVHPFKSNTISSGSGSSPSLSIRQGVSGHGAVPFAGGGSPSSGVGGILPHNLHSRQASSSSARVPPSPVHVASFAPSSLGDRDRRSGSGSRASLDKDRERRGSSSGVGVAMGVGGERDRETETERNTHEGMSVPMAMPPRKRYSSSFGHRYVSSVGSATGGGVVGAGSGAGSASASGSGISAGSGGKAMVEGGSPGSGNGSGVGVGPGREGGGARKEGITSLLGLGATTDDDDISIFVQHIDERKPLSSHDKERERDRDVLAMRAAAATGQGHDREATDNTTTTSKGKQRAAAAVQEGEDQHEDEDEDEDEEEDNGRLRFGLGLGLGLGLGHARYTTSPPPPISALVPGSNVTSTATSTSNNEDDEDSAAAAAALLSTSPNRGPMLTSRDEVDERLKRMNENFLKSLEGIGGSRSRMRGRETRKGSVAATTAGMRGGKEKEKADDSSHSNSKERPESAASSSSAASNNNNKDKDNNNNNPPTSRFSQRTLDVGFPSTSSSSSSRGGGGGGGVADVYPSYPYNNNNNTPSLGLGLGRGRHTPLSSSAMLGNSDGISMASQGSEEVIGRMELYEERRRSGYHGS